MVADYLIVGSGLTGATIARTLVDHGHDVLVLERRTHVGGNVHDHLHECGIRIHTYGPHYFRTGSERIWNFVSRFADFYKFEAVLMTRVDGRLEHWPVQSEYIERMIGSSWSPARCGTATNFEEASLAMMPAMVYEKFVRGYSAKQWGVDPKLLEPGLSGRFDVRHGEARLKTSRYQGIPVGGYAGFMRNMLRGVPILTGIDYLKCRDRFSARKLVVFTGPIDEYFNFVLGKLTYRGQRREHVFMPGVQWHQPVPQVNYPDPTVPFIRTLEWKHMMEPDEIRNISGSVITRETPYSPSDAGDYEYPFPEATNRRLYEKYRDRAGTVENLLVCGRLGEFRYFDMDQAIGRALMIANRILHGEQGQGQLLADEA
jgi:UDP-galactopyranose mutase